MRFFINKKMLFKLIVSLCICLTLINIGVPHEVQAGWLFDTGASAAKQGGKLLAPLIDLVLTLGDGVIDIIQQAIMGTESSITIDTVRKGIIGILTAALAIAIVVAVVVIAGPFVAGLIPIISSIAVGAIAVATITIGGSVVSAAYTAMSASWLPQYTVLPLYTISPEEIFKGRILLFDVNIFNPRELYVKIQKDDTEYAGLKTATNWNAKNSDGTFSDTERNAGYEVKYYYYFKDRNSNNGSEDNIVITSANNSAYELKNTVSKWYYTLRNVAIVALMLVLIYVGIKIMLSSTAAEKSKYKQMLGDWFVAICLLFVMHYIMIFANSFTENITDLLASVAEQDKHTVIIKDAETDLKNEVEEAGLGSTITGNDIVWPTNLMGKARMMAEEQNGTTGYVGYALCYLVLVVYTVVFTITYAKRLLYIVFFTIIAPLVAVSYPLDKINDGKSQAFDIWLKEYIFNLLIQPFHLLLYIILISTAFDLAGTNIIYSLVAIGFMTPAEKFLRKMFGFDKASTPGFLEGATGAALTMHGLHSLEKIAGRGPGGNKGKTGSNGETDKNKIDFMSRSADSGHKTSDLMNSLTTGDSPTSPNGGENTDNEDTNPDEGNPVSEENSDQNNGESGDGIDYERANAFRNLRANGLNQEDALEQLNDGMPFDRDRDPEVQSGGGEPAPDDGEPDPADGESDPADGGPTPADRGSTSSGKIKPQKNYIAARFSNFRKANFNKERVLSTTADVIRKGSGIAMGAAGGMIGAAAGIASGDLKGTVQNTMTGAYAGSSIGTGIANSGINRISQAKAKHEEALKEMYGQNYSAYLKQRKDKMFEKDSEMRALYKRELGLKSKKEIDQAMKDATEYRKYGVTDNETILKAMQMDGGNSANRTSKERIAAAKLSTISKSNKDIETNMKQFAKTPGVTQQQIKDMEKRIRYINDL